MNIFSKITLRNLLKNRSRTAVTIIGIALSAALFTAVTTSVSTLVNFMTRYVAYTHGSWHAAGYSMTDNELTQLRGNNKTDKIVTLQNIGFANPGNSTNEAKPYIFIAGIDSDFTELMPVHITEGRMPAQDTELLLPEHLATNGGITHQIGDVLNLEVGSRVGDGYTMNNHQAFISEEGEEILTDTTLHTYTVVGFYERPSFEDFTAPGYTALTFTGSASASGTYDVYFTLHRSSQTNSFIQQNSSLFPEGADVNTGYLLTRGTSDESGINTMLRGLAAILIAIISFGSISLIYNAFSISVNERTKQFGMLSSIGATKKQLRRSVLTEGILLGIVGIPLGIVIGLLGIGITFHFLSGMMATALIGDVKVPIIFHPSFVAMGIAILVSFVTIMISAFIPAKRATGISAIDAIRQAQDIQAKAKTLRTSRLTQKLFGFEGTLAAKYYKRSRKKYRATIISLFMSIVLFISASSFTSYLTKSVNSVYGGLSFDINVWVSFSDSHSVAVGSVEDFCKSVKDIGEVENASYSTSLFYQDVFINEECISDSFQTGYRSAYAANPDEPDGADSIPSQIVFLEDGAFRQLMKENHVSEDGYFDKGTLKALCCNQMTMYTDGQYHVYEPIRSLKNANIRIAFEMGTWDVGGDFNQSETWAVPIECDTVINPPKNVPCPYETGRCIYFYLPYSSIGTVREALRDETLVSYVDCYNVLNQIAFCISTTDHAKTAQQLDEMVSLFAGDDPLAGYGITDYAAEMESTRTMLFVVNVFAYGFIILISLITVANVFNTLNTNVNLRRREFAMLRSVGMTPKGFIRMVNYECLLYGFKSLLFGLPASILITYLIYRAVGAEIAMVFFIPWHNVLIAVGSVFLITFATMIYSMKKVSRENTVDALKNDNL